MEVKNFLSEEDCRRIINKMKIGKLVKINDYSVNALTTQSNPEVVGLMGNYYRVKINANIAGKDGDFQYFVKKKPQNVSIIDQFAEESGCFEREKLFFNCLINDFDDDWAPKCYLAKDDFIVFKDLSVENYELPKIEMLDEMHCKVILIALAKLHAETFRIEQTLGKSLNEIAPKYFGPFSFLSRRDNATFAWYISGIDSICEVIKLMPEYKLKSEELSKLVRQKFDQVYKLKISSKKYSNVLCHADLWRFNFFIKYNEKIPEKCCLLDYQLIQYTPPAHDVVQFMTTNTNASFREKYLHKLLDYYYDEFRKRVTSLNLENVDIEKIHSKDEFLASCKEEIQLSIIITVIQKSICHIGKTFLNKIMNNPDMYTKFMGDSRKFYILEKCQEDEQYKLLLFDAIREMFAVFNGKYYS